MSERSASTTVWPLEGILGFVGSDYAEAMKKVVTLSAPDLKAANLRKRRHCFNRTLPSGPIHVIFFWMAPKEPPAWTEVPGLRERLYGSFRVDLGVWIPEVTRGKRSLAPGAWINEYDCDLRVGLTQAMTGKLGSTWWSLDDPLAAVTAREALLEHGVPLLDRFPDQESILKGFEELNAPWELGITPAARLDIAQIYAAQGRKDDERRTLERYVTNPVHPAHAQYLHEYLAAVGHADLIERISPQPLPNV